MNEKHSDSNIQREGLCISHLNPWSLIYNMLFANIMILFPFQVIDLFRSRSQKDCQKIYCFIHFGPAEILHSSVFCGVFNFLSFTLCDPYVFLTSNAIEVPSPGA